MDPATERERRRRGRVAGRRALAVVVAFGGLWNAFLAVTAVHGVNVRRLLVALVWFGLGWLFWRGRLG